MKGNERKWKEMKGNERKWKEINKNQWKIKENQIKLQKINENKRFLHSFFSRLRRSDFRYTKIFFLTFSTVIFFVRLRRGDFRYTKIFFNWGPSTGIVENRLLMRILDSNAFWWPFFFWSSWGPSTVIFESFSLKRYFFIYLFFLRRSDFRYTKIFLLTFSNVFFFASPARRF